MVSSLSLLELFFVGYISSCAPATSPNRHLSCQPGESWIIENFSCGRIDVSRRHHFQPKFIHESSTLQLKSVHARVTSSLILKSSNGSLNEKNNSVNGSEKEVSNFLKTFLDLFKKTPGFSAEEVTVDVAVVGAGVAGLVCARKLYNAGLKVLLIESTDSIGGRVKTDVVDGFLLDRGFQIFIEEYPEAKKQIDYPKLNLRPFKPGALVYLNGTLNLVSDPVRCPEDLLAALMSPVGTIWDKLRVGLYRLIVPMRPLDVIFTSPETDTRDYLQSQLGLSDDIIAKFFEPFYKGIFLSPLEQQSSRMFSFIFQMLAKGSASLPEAGMMSVPLALADGLPSSVIRLNSTVTNVLRAKKSLGPKLTLQNGDVVNTMATVIATDGPEAFNLLQKAGKPLDGFLKPPPPGRSSTCLYYSLPHPPPVTKPILILNGDGASDEKPINNMVFLDQCAASYAPTGQSLASVTVVGTPDMTDSDLEGRVQRQLGEWFGEEAVAKWKHLRTYRIPYAQPSQTPPSIQGKTGFDKEVVLGDGLYCCGDHRSTATLNGAMESGSRAADAVLEAFIRLN